MEYQKTYNSYINYINKSKQIIKSLFLTEKDSDNLIIDSPSSAIDEIIKNHRLKMIDIKVEHTMRMIEQVIKINENLGIKTDLNLVIKIATLYHDIGRIRQSTWSNTFGDSSYIIKHKPYKNHAEDGYNIFINEDFNIKRQYIPIISQVILHHQEHNKYPNLNYRFNTPLKEIEIEEIITGNTQLNEAEWQIASLIVQLVSDIDKTDILYQHLSSDFDMIRDYVYDISMKSLDEIAKEWKVLKKDIIEYNRIDESTYIPQKIKVPIKNVELSKIEIPDYMKDMFYNNTWPDLKVLIQDKHWNFITILWWRLSHFLNEISFNATLINIEESKLLEQIYQKIPQKYQPLVKEAFDYSQEVLIKQALKENEGNIYLRKKRHSYKKTNIDK